MDASPYIAVGRIVKTHGVAGELSVAQTTSFALDALLGKEVWVVPPVRIAKPYRVSEVRPGPKGPLVTLEGVDDIAHGREMVGASICVPSDDVPLEILVENEDLVGYRVIDVDRGDLGVIDEIIVTGANDVWVVHGPLGEVLLPVIEEVVLEVDDDAGTISVRLLPGLLADES